MTWVWDSLSNDAMARALGQRLGENLSDAEVAEVRAALDTAVRQIPAYPRWLTSEEATQICLETLRGIRGLATA
jgi:hypothetical protein